MEQTPILTVTLNPALDFSGVVPQLGPRRKLRLKETSCEPGGGGINVARAIRRMGGDAQAFAPLGGGIGTHLAELLEAEGVPMVWFGIDGQTRHSLAVHESASGDQFRFVMPGPHWPPAQSEAALEAIAEAAPRDCLVVLSGSQPPGVPDGFPAELAARLGPRRRLVIDTSGAALDAVLSGGGEARPDVLRMDQAEGDAAAGATLESVRESVDFAAGLVARRVAHVVVLARGAEGSVLVDAQGLRLLCAPPTVELVSAVGAGDSFAGGFTLALARGQPMSEALRMGTAAAAAAVTTKGTELCRGPDVERLLPQCRISEVPAG